VPAVERAVGFDGPGAGRLISHASRPKGVKKPQSSHDGAAVGAKEIVAEAAGWGADLIVLGFPRRGELMTRLFGSVTLRVLEHAPCPVLVASPAGKASVHRTAESVASVTGPDPDVHDRHPADGRGDNLSTAPAR
jgi:hypothetical protein